MSKHGKIVSMLGNQWNWDVQLKDAFAKGGQSAPTCAGCHMEYEGEFAHNMVRKIRWPTIHSYLEFLKTSRATGQKHAWTHG